jgi:hypothetical protein
MPQAIDNVLTIVELFVLLVLLAFARTWMRRAMHNKIETL